MTATGQDFTLYRGEDKVVEVTIAGSGSIASWTFEASFRRSNRELDAISPIVTKDSDSGITIESAEDRVVHITLTDDDTLLFFDGLKERRYPWDLKRTNTGSESVLATGEVTVLNPSSR